MNLEMNLSELKQVKAAKFNGISVMDCPLPALAEICREALGRIDNYQQEAGNQNKTELAAELSDTFDELEEVYRHLKNGGMVSANTRDTIRQTIKHTEKLVAVELFFPPQHSNTATPHHNPTAKQ